ncbi:MAG: DUF5060 domain-containing protein, partial [candidate division KSB1 bacterium]|nr:DUF5060 domain-containing protein [candidate division KSB1 bacterium]
MQGIKLFWIFFIHPLALWGLTVTLSPTPVPRYHVLEMTFEENVSTVNPYDQLVEAVFVSPSRVEITVSGFYDGERQWKIRFMPDRIGQWQVRWRFGNAVGESEFTCTAQTHPKIHGHIRIDPHNPRKLRYEDGTPLFWHGGKYLCIMRPFGTSDLQELSFPERLDTQTYVSLCRKYFQDISRLGLNGAVFKVQVLPLDYNLREMNLAFFRAMDEIVQAAMWNGINLQITLFDVWGKRKQNTDWSLQTPLSADWLLLEPWNEYSFIKETKFYLEYIVKRYAAFPNIIWELWNEAEKFKFSAARQTEVYRRIIQQADPYDLLIGASEMYTAPYGLDLCHAHLRYKCWPDQWDFMYWAIHNDKRYAPYYFKYNMPYIWNEIGPWENDATHFYTEEDYRNWHRATFWSALTLGAAGISEEHWSDIRFLPNEITRQHSFFIRFVDQLQDVNALQSSDELRLLNGKGFLCRRGDDELVAYLFTQQNKSRIEFDLYLGKTTLGYRFYNPKTGEWLSNSTRYEARAEGWHRFKTPTFDQDIVFYAVKETITPATPVEWGKLEVQIQGDTVLLFWQT